MAGGISMTRLRAKINKAKEEFEEEEMENGELNLVPYLDIVTNVIMFLMMTTTFAAALADINVTAPTVATRGDGPVDPGPTKQDLNLTVQISEKGFTVAASGAVLYENNIPGRVPTIPKKGADYDKDGLGEQLARVKKDYGLGTKMVVTAESDVTYEYIVEALDASREREGQELFPDVVLAVAAGVK